MSNAAIRTIIRAKFLLIGRESASRSIIHIRNKYLKIAESISLKDSLLSVTVPPMVGVDPEMREWSFFQILEHNAIVNRIIFRNVQKLALGEDPAPDHPVDPKTDVLPRGISGPEQVAAFRESVDEYVAMVAMLPSLRGTAETPHPVFGAFDAHKWHCMFGFHLGLHLKQAEKVLSLLPS